ncbi:MAG: hypothetical protein M3004_02780 [Bacteroidota bacterium]|nr:hypothetical protein [Bacteroidota bacterium]
MSRTYNPGSYEEDMQAIRESNKIDVEDVELLNKYILVSKFAGNDLQGKSYDDILDKIKTIRKTTGQQNEQLKSERDVQRERSSSIVTVSLVDKSFTKVNNKDCLVYSVSFKNISDKNIKMIVGSISINNLLDKEIKKIDIVFDENLKANATVKKIYTVSYNHADENDKRIRTKDLATVRVEWNPEKIIFENGQLAE